MSREATILSRLAIPFQMNVTLSYGNSAGVISQLYGWPETRSMLFSSFSYFLFISIQSE